MFCRFGFVLESRPVAARRLRERRVDAAVGGDRRGSATRYVECSFVSSRQRSTTATIGCRSRIFASTRWSVE